MAFISVTQAKGLSKPNDGDYNLIPVLDRKISTVITLSHSTASVSSSAFDASTRFVRIVSDAACFYDLGSSPTAANTGGTATRYLPAGVFVVEPVNGGDKVAVISTA